MNSLLKSSLVAGLTVIGTALTGFGSVRPVDAAMVGSPMDNLTHNVNFTIGSSASGSKQLDFKVNDGGQVPQEVTGNLGDKANLTFLNIGLSNLEAFVFANTMEPLKNGEVFSYTAINGTGGVANYNITVDAVPEPSNVFATLAFGASFAAWQLKGRKKSQKSAAQLVSKS